MTSLAADTPEPAATVWDSESYIAHILRPSVTSHKLIRIELPSPQIYNEHLWPSRDGNEIPASTESLPGL